MPDYHGRLDRIEAAIAPEPRSPLIVFVECGESSEDAAARYATARELVVADVLARAVFVSWRAGA